MDDLVSFQNGSEILDSPAFRVVLLKLEQKEAAHNEYFSTNNYDIEQASSEAIMEQDKENVLSPMDTSSFCADNIFIFYISKTQGCSSINNHRAQVFIPQSHQIERKFICVFCMVLGICMVFLYGFRHCLMMLFVCGQFWGSMLHGGENFVANLHLGWIHQLRASDLSKCWGKRLLSHRHHI